MRLNELSARTSTSTRVSLNRTKLLFIRETESWCTTGGRRKVNCWQSVSIKQWTSGMREKSMSLCGLMAMVLSDDGRMSGWGMSVDRKTRRVSDAMSTVGTTVPSTFCGSKTPLIEHHVRPVRAERKGRGKPVHWSTLSLHSDRGRAVREGKVHRSISSAVNCVRVLRGTSHVALLRCNVRRAGKDAAMGVL